VEPDGTVVKKAAIFGLEIRQVGTMYRVLRDGETTNETPSLTLAEAYFDVLRDEAKSATGKDPERERRAERAFSDMLAVKGEATRRRQSGEQAKGGKGGRSGV
jgi:hypothetical protein